jgi:hypothetical protein
VQQATLFQGGGEKEEPSSRCFYDRYWIPFIREYASMTTDGYPRRPIDGIYSTPPSGSFPGFPLTPATDPCQNGKERCVVAFAIYGTDSFYLDGGRRNIILGRRYWPGWRLRFYTDESLPQRYVDELTTETSEVVVVSGVKGHIAGMFWRLFVASDPTVDRYIVRDIDSSPGSRERAAMDEWILSERTFHVMRDAPVHSGWPIVGCCWGGVGSESLGGYAGVEGLIRSGNVDHLMLKKGGDQDFLEQYFWPLMTVGHKNLISHDSFHCLEYPSTRPYPTQKKGTGDMIAPISNLVATRYPANGEDDSSPWMAARILEDNGNGTLQVDFLAPGAVRTVRTDEVYAYADLLSRSFPLLPSPYGEVRGPGVRCPYECRPMQHKDWIHC